MEDGPSGQTGRPAVRRAGEEFRFVNDPAPTQHRLLVGQIVLESPMEFSRATILLVSFNHNTSKKFQKKQKKVHYFMQNHQQSTHRCKLWSY